MNSVFLTSLGPVLHLFFTESQQSTSYETLKEIQVSQSCFICHTKYAAVRTEKYNGIKFHFRCHKFRTMDSILVAWAFLVKYFYKEGHTFILTWETSKELPTFQGSYGTCDCWYKWNCKGILSLSSLGSRHQAPKSRRNTLMALVSAKL